MLFLVWNEFGVSLLGLVLLQWGCAWPGVMFEACGVCAHTPDLTVSRWWYLSAVTVVQLHSRSVLSSLAVFAGDELTGKNLEGSGEEEASTFLQGEELAEEQEEGQAAEDDGEDHESLDRLDPLCGGGVSERRLQSITDTPTLAQSIVCTQRACEGRGAPEWAVDVPPLAAE